MKEEHLDEVVLLTMSRLLVLDEPAGRLMQKLWSERRHMLDTLEAIDMWDMAHSEALTLDRALQLVRDQLEELRKE